MASPGGRGIGPRWAVMTGIFALALLAVAAVGALMFTDVLTLGLGQDRARALGAELIGGAIVGLAVLGAEIGFGLQLQHLEKERERVAQREALRLQLGMGRDFPGIDLEGRDLRSFYLPERDLTGANLKEVMLEGAHLLKAVLVHADLFEANLCGANLAHADLQGANLTFANLERADLQHANLKGAVGLDAGRLRGALYSDDTVWPDDYTPPAGERCDDHAPGEPDHYHHA